MQGQYETQQPKTGSDDERAQLDHLRRSSLLASDVRLYAFSEGLMLSDYTIFGIVEPEKLIRMDCPVMQRLKVIETQARTDCKKSTEYEFQILYGQHSLEAKRIQRLHWQECGICLIITVEGVSNGESARPV